jgi:Putative peptidoglycan binding domain
MALGNLRAGASGPEVKAIQQGLNIRRVTPRLEEDGIFGPRTERAVRDYQRRHRLKVDGIFGPETRRSLFWIGVATVTVVGRRDPKLTYLWPQHGAARPGTEALRRPLPDGEAGLHPGQLQLADNDDLNTTICNGLCASNIRPRHIWPLEIPIPAPALPDWNLAIEPPAEGAPSRPLEFVYDYIELQPGERSRFWFASARQDAFILTMQSVYRRGPDDGPNLQAALGVQVGAPFMNGPWTINPFIQLTDVDRLGALGAFHYWQPYAQIGFRTPGPRSAPGPTLADRLFPLDLTLNMVKDVLWLGIGGGVALNLDLHTGQIQAGSQLSFGLSVELGHPDAPF